MRRVISSSKFKVQSLKLLTHNLLLLTFALAVILMFSSYNPYSPSKKTYRLNKVVIDAGHGGKDPGCIGFKHQEKDVALSIALALGHYIEKNYPDVIVIYTRRDDRFVELYQRAEIANKNKADLFISIHCNANPSSNPFGVETYVMGLHKTEANLAVAKKENSSILLEDNYKKKYEGFDPNSDESYIIFSLYQNAYLEQSLNLASKIEKKFQDDGRTDRGVKQAGFLVLFRTYMPSMLIETGFLSNSKEAEFLSSEKGQNTIAFSIYKAFKDYKNELEGTKSIEQTAINSLQSTVHSPQSKDSSKHLTNNSPESPFHNTQSKDSSKQITNNIQRSTVHDLQSKDSSKQITNNSPLSAVHNLKKTNNCQQSTIYNPQKTNNSPESTISSTKTKGSNTANKELQTGIFFKVQFYISPNKMSLNSPVFRGTKNIEYYLENGYYKYTVGNEKSLDETKKLQKQMREAGFKDAFIIAFSEGQKISISEALKLINKKK